ncbi:MAG: GTPase HflX [Thermoplasmata archaeon]|jgi:GTP-binding protein HflX
MVFQKAITVSDKYDNEFENLARSLYYEVLYSFTFKHYSSKYYIGEGKIEEIKNYIENNSVEVIIINGKLKSSQWYNLETYFKRRVIDKTMLILEIFADRAKTKEAKLEVELATLNYQLPLLKEWIHRAKIGEHPGFMAGGEYDIDQYYFHVQKRIKKIKEELEKVKIERKERRKNRLRKGYFLITIAGYTNSGKSQLMKTLSGEDVVIENRMFSTLVPRTSRIMNTKKKILITDTVGFIKDLPPLILEAFRATLEDIYDSDLIIFLIDGSDPFDIFKEKIEASLSILSGELTGKILPVINKIDKKIEDIENKKRYINEKISDPVLISAKTGENINLLLERIYSMLNYDREYDLEIDSNKNYMPLISFVYEYGEIIYYEIKDKIYLKFKINSRFDGTIKKYLNLL